MFVQNKGIPMLYLIFLCCVWGSSNNQGRGGFGLGEGDGLNGVMTLVRGQWNRGKIAQVQV